MQQIVVLSPSTVLDFAVITFSIIAFEIPIALMGYAAGNLKQIFYEEDMTIPIVLIGVADFIYGIAIYIFSFFSRGRSNFLFYLRKIILPEVYYTLILAIFLYRLIIFINNKIDKGSENRID